MSKSNAKMVEPLRSNVQLDQAKLNIAERKRTSRLPWRGQFSPELVEHLMQQVCDGARVFFDPFSGSGTVLYEALRHGKSALGLEVNPAAWHLAALSSFSGLSPIELADATQGVRAVQMASEQVGTLFSDDVTPSITSEISDSGPRPHNLALAATALLSMGNKSAASATDIVRGAAAVLAVLTEVQTYSGTADCLLRDARQNELPDASVDAVITSPPYINVFNYHQNYRPACEMLGWKPLQAARSEIGANRKHRQNRFLTVIQYCMDMDACLAETARTMTSGAPLVIVLGRTSNVLGTPFENGRIIKALIEGSGKFSSVQSAERMFVGRFGDRIYEDILVAYRDGYAVGPRSDPKAVGMDALRRASTLVPAKNSSLLEEAIETGAEVEGSPMLHVQVPAAFGPKGH